MARMDLVPIGYFPKRVVSGHEALKVVTVHEICSVSDCISEAPDNWINQWRHNEMWLFDTEALARQVVADAIHVEVLKDPRLDPPWRAELTRVPADQFTLFYYRLLPFTFVEGRQEDFAIPELKVAAPDASFERLGFDAVSRTMGNAFECSPLSCNGLARDFPVNAHCLLDDVALAIEAAKRFGQGEAEPGPYFVVEVSRQSARPKQAVLLSENRFEWSSDQLQALVSADLDASNAFRPDQPIDEQWRLTSRHGYCKPIRSWCPVDEALARNPEA
jgi:hypothetical protein